MNFRKLAVVMICSLSLFFQSVSADTFNFNNAELILHKAPEDRVLNPEEEAVYNGDSGFAGTEKNTDMTGVVDTDLNVFFMNPLAGQDEYGIQGVLAGDLRDADYTCNTLRQALEDNTNVDVDITHAATTITQKQDEQTLTKRTFVDGDNDCCEVTFSWETFNIDDNEDKLGSEGTMSRVECEPRNQGGGPKEEVEGKVETNSEELRALGKKINQSFKDLAKVKGDLKRAGSNIRFVRGQLRCSIDAREQRGELTVGSPLAGTTTGLEAIVSKILELTKKAKSGLQQANDHKIRRRVDEGEGAHAFAVNSILIASDLVDQLRNKSEKIVETEKGCRDILRRNKPDIRDAVRKLIAANRIVNRRFAKGKNPFTGRSGDFGTCEKAKDIAKQAEADFEAEKQAALELLKSSKQFLDNAKDIFAGNRDNNFDAEVNGSGDVTKSADAERLEAFGDEISSSEFDADQAINLAQTFVDEANLDIDLALEDCKEFCENGKQAKARLINLSRITPGGAPVSFNTIVCEAPQPASKKKGLSITFKPNAAGKEIGLVDETVKIVGDPFDHFLRFSPSGATRTTSLLAILAFNLEKPLFGSERVAISSNGGAEINDFVTGFSLPVGTNQQLQSIKRRADTGFNDTVGSVDFRRTKRTKDSTAFFIHADNVSFTIKKVAETNSFTLIFNNYQVTLFRPIPVEGRTGFNELENVGTMIINGLPSAESEEFDSFG